jgi:mannan endo-1,4-beta-mannosidase
LLAFVVLGLGLNACSDDDSAPAQNMESLPAQEAGAPQADATADAGGDGGMDAATDAGGERSTEDSGPPHSDTETHAAFGPGGPTDAGPDRDSTVGGFDGTATDTDTDDEPVTDTEAEPETEQVETTAEPEGMEPDTVHQPDVPLDGVDAGAEADAGADGDSGTDAGSHSDSGSDAGMTFPPEAGAVDASVPDASGLPFEGGTEAGVVQAPPLADPLATEETIALWTYLNATEGEHSLAGIWEHSGLESVEATSGRVPALLGQDMSGWQPRESDYWYAAMAEQRNALIQHHANGGVIQVNWHWDNPFDSGDPAVGAWTAIDDTQWDTIITPGTTGNDDLLWDIDLHVTNFLSLLVDEDGRPIPALFRPLHEIDGGWFWWTSLNDPARSAELYRIIYRRVTDYHGLHNLIWVWNTSEVMASAEQAELYYPGDEYVDIVAWDGYHVDYETTGRRVEWDGSTLNSYRTYYDWLGEIAPGKPRALAEADALPNPDLTQSGDENFVPWLYVMPWWAPVDGNGTGVCFSSPCNPDAWVNATYNHDFYTTLDELPPL